MDEEQVLKLMLDGGPGAVEAFSAWIEYQYWVSVVDWIGTLLLWPLIIGAAAGGIALVVRKLAAADQKADLDHKADMARLDRGHNERMAKIRSGR
jgi:hypothetical protein